MTNGILLSSIEIKLTVSKNVMLNIVAALEVLTNFPENKYELSITPVKLLGQNMYSELSISTKSPAIANAVFEFLKK